MQLQRRSKDDSLALSKAYAQMLTEPGIWDTLGIARQTVLNARVRVNKRQYPPTDSMRTWLKRAGWKMEVEERWAPKRRSRRAA